MQIASQSALTKNQKYVMERFRGQIYITNQLDVQTGRLWDCMTFRAGEEFTSGEWFSTPEPKGNPPKTRLETNLNQSRRLDAPEAFSVERVVITFSKYADPYDVAALQDGAWWQFFVGQKYYLWSIIGHMATSKEPISPIRICDFCRSVFVEQSQCPGCGARSFKLTTLGDAGQQFMMDVKPEIVLANQISFYVVLRSSRPIRFRNDLKIWFHCEGLHARGVC